MIRRTWTRWVALWDRREAPLTLAALRIGLALVLLSDQVHTLILGLVPTLFGPASAGGLGDPVGASTPPELYRLLPDSAATAWLAFGLWMAATLAFGAGLFTRWSGALTLLLYAQLALVLPAADRGIDMLVRNALMILIFSECGAAWSLDARRRVGRFAGDGEAVPAWPRHLLILQLIVVYFGAGSQKVGMDWLPMGGWTALYVVLHDPAVSRFGFGHLDLFFPLTQLATAVTWIWEWCSPLLLLSFVYRDSRTRPGRLRALLNRLDFRSLWLAVGVIFHLGIALTMRLGIFPWAMITMYLAFYHPDELRAGWARLRRPRSLRAAEVPS